MLILEINESHVKMLGNNKFQKVVKLSNFCGSYFCFYNSNSPNFFNDNKLLVLNNTLGLLL